MKSLLDEMANHDTEIRDILGDTLGVFTELYSPYLAGFSATECEEIKNSITSDMFMQSATQSNAAVKKAAEDYRKGQVKAQLFQALERQNRRNKESESMVCKVSDSYTLPH